MKRSLRIGLVSAIAVSALAYDAYLYFMQEKKKEAVTEVVPVEYKLEQIGNIKLSKYDVYKQWFTDIKKTYLTQLAMEQGLLMLVNISFKTNRDSFPTTFPCKLEYPNLTLESRLSAVRKNGSTANGTFRYTIKDSLQCTELLEILSMRDDEPNVYIKFDNDSTWIKL